MIKLKYHPDVDIPQAVRKLNTLSGSRISEWIWSKFNVKRSDDSIRIWFKRHPEIRDILEKEIGEKGLVPKEYVVTLATFKKGTFERLDSIDNWIRFKRRKIDTKGKIKREKWITDSVSALKRFCKGVFPHTDKNTHLSYRMYMRKGNKREDFEPIDLKEKGWTLKHPDRVTEKDAIDFIDLMNDYYPDVDTSCIRIPLRDFLKSKGLEAYKIDEISGDAHRSKGKYKKLIVPVDEPSMRP